MITSEQRKLRQKDYYQKESPEKKALRAKKTKEWRHSLSPKRKAERKQKGKERRGVKPNVGRSLKKVLKGKDYLTTYNALLKEQKGKCAICGRPATQFRYRLSIDHCHKKGHIRGLLCTPCNRNLAFVELYPKQVIKYLKRAPPNV